MRLGRKYGWERTDQACRRALAFDLINVKRVQRIIEQGLAAPPVPETSASPDPVAQLPLRFARPANSFSHHNQKQGETDERSTQLNEGGPQEAPPLGASWTPCPDRAAYAKKAKLAPMEFLELTLQDEIDRRERKTLSVRIERAGFEEEQTLEGFDWDAPVTFDRDRVRDLFSLEFLERHEDVLFLGPVGVGKTFLAGALGHAACRAGKQVRFLRADKMLKQLRQSRADNSTEKTLRALIMPQTCWSSTTSCLRRLNAEQSSDFYEVVSRETQTRFHHRHQQPRGRRSGSRFSTI